MFLQNTSYLQFSGVGLGYVRQDLDTVVMTLADEQQNSSKFCIDERLISFLQLLRLPLCFLHLQCARGWIRVCGTQVNTIVMTIDSSSISIMQLTATIF